MMIAFFCTVLLEFNIKILLAYPLKKMSLVNALLFYSLM